MPIARLFVELKSQLEAGVRFCSGSELLQCLLHPGLIVVSRLPRSTVEQWNFHRPCRYSLWPA
jgi:hypothetical protein